MSWQAYTLSISQPGRPHVLEVDYPSDVPQTLGLSILEPNAAGRPGARSAWTRASTWTRSRWSGSHAALGQASADLLAADHDAASCW